MHYRRCNGPVCKPNRERNARTDEACHWPSPEVQHMIGKTTTADFKARSTADLIAGRQAAHEPPLRR